MDSSSIIPFTKDNHYVPQSYLKHWAAQDGRVWTYRILVSNSNVPKWEARSVRGIAYHSHLYTRIVAGGQTDEFEKWLNREYETPTEPIINKVISEQRLTPDDWVQLIKFLAAQDVRTPARLLESLKRWDETMPQLMKDTLDKSIHKLQTTRMGSKEIAQSPFSYSELIPLDVSTIRDPQSKTTTLKVQTTIGRELAV